VQTQTTARKCFFANVVSTGSAPSCTPSHTIIWVAHSMVWSWHGSGEFHGALRMSGSWLMQDRRAPNPLSKSRDSPSKLVLIHDFSAPDTLRNSSRPGRPSTANVKLKQPVHHHPVRLRCRPQTLTERRQPPKPLRYKPRFPHASPKLSLNLTL